MYMSASAPVPPPLKRWMRYLLIFAGCFNLLAGFCMIVFYHEGYKLLGLPKPQIILPVQVMGVLVGLFGVGYLLVAHNPLQNRHLLTLGFLSKAISSLLALASIFEGDLPWSFFPVLFFSDIIYLPPFYAIMRRITSMAKKLRCI